MTSQAVTVFDDPPSHQMQLYSSVSNWYLVGATVAGRATEETTGTIRAEEEEIGVGHSVNGATNAENYSK